MTHHARLRAKQRYGLTVGAEDARAIREQVMSGRALKLGKTGRRTSVYLVTVQQQDCVVVYNRGAKIVITFLPLNWNPEEHRRRRKKHDPKSGNEAQPSRQEPARRARPIRERADLPR